MNNELLKKNTLRKLGIDWQNNKEKTKGKGAIQGQISDEAD